VHLTNLKRSVDVETLPRTSLTYEGREANAPWRKAAAQRIERLRKGDFRVLVVGKNGRPLRAARVQIHMTRRAFAFGSSIENLTFMPSPDKPYAQKYRAMTYRLFNKVTVNNALKWNSWEGTS